MRRKDTPHDPWHILLHLPSFSLSRATFGAAREGSGGTSSLADIETRWMPSTSVCAQSFAIFFISHAWHVLRNLCVVIRSAGERMSPLDVAKLRSKHDTFLSEHCYCQFVGQIQVRLCCGFKALQHEYIPFVKYATMSFPIVPEDCICSCHSDVVWATFNLRKWAVGSITHASKDPWFPALCQPLNDVYFRTFILLLEKWKCLHKVHPTSTFFTFPDCHICPAGIVCGI